MSERHPLAYRRARGDEDWPLDGAGWARSGLSTVEGAEALLGPLVPAAVAVSEAFDDEPAHQTPGEPVVEGGWGLWPGEGAHLVDAVARRRREFATGRRCAREALVALGLAPAPILTGAGREPLWPPGVVGSITHCEGYRAAAVSRRTSDVAGLGVDAEPHLVLPPGVLEVVADEAERRHVAERVSADPDTAWDRLLFSAKESVYKAWFPVTGAWLGFEQVQVELGAERFVATLTDSGVDLIGRWRRDDGLLLTAVVLTAADAARLTALSASWTSSRG